MHYSRSATTEDYPVACAFWRAFGAEQPPPSEADWNARYRDHVLFLMTDDDEIAGYSLCIPLGSRGDIRHIMVTPSMRGRGVGRALMAAVRQRLVERGCTEWRLEVRGDNTAAIALYEGAGMRVVHALVTLRMTRDLATAFAQPGVVDVVDPRDDARLEERWDLGGGQLAHWRAIPQTILWRIDEDALAHYRIEIAPGLSLLFPFRARTIAQAAALVDAAVRVGMRETLELLVVGDSEAAPLVAAGATVTERMLEMGGSLLVSPEGAGPTALR